MRIELCCVEGVCDNQVSYSKWTGYFGYEKEIN